MGEKKNLNNIIASFGWGILFVWWGICILIDPITIAMSAIGSGLILLGVNAVRMLKGIPTRESTTTVGVIALTWGVFDQVGSALHLASGLSFALLVLIIGVYICIRTSMASVKKSNEANHEIL